MILVERPSNYIKYQGYDYAIKEHCVDIIYNGKVQLVDLSLNSSNCITVDLEQDIEYFVGNKFLYIDDEVELNPDFKE